jgi:hypothetical protein
MLGHGRQLPYRAFLRIPYRPDDQISPTSRDLFLLVAGSFDGVVF